jgi:subtilisin family serine protease
MAVGYITDQNFQIARGLIRGASHINKFGYNSSVGATFETVWDGSNLYTYIGTAGTALVTSSNTSDDNNGTVEIQGLDANYNVQTVTATIGGSATTETFIRVFRVKLLTANTGTSNVGTITVTVDSTAAAIISPTKGQTLMAVYTIPAGKKGYLLKLQGNLEKAKESEFQLMARPFGGAFNIKGKFGSSGDVVNYDYPVPLEFDEKTDIEIQVRAGATTAAGALFDIVLLDNPRTMQV